MKNQYQPPTADVGEIPGDSTNNSGGGSRIQLPPGVKGWSWGAFFWSGIWGPFNRVWIGLLAFVPYLGIIVAIYLGIKGRELSWRRKRWDSIEHFNRVQRSWSKWGLIFLFMILIFAIAVALPAYHNYTVRARSGA